MADTLVVRRAAFSLEEPWTTPAGCEPVRLRLAPDGATPRLATSIAAWFDDVHLSVLFSASDDRIIATHYAHDAPLYEEDVVEVFLAPRALTEYFEIEVSPLGTVFDARIESPEGHRRSMKTDLSWTCRGLLAAVRKMPESNGVLSIDTLLRIPFEALSRSTPAAGETWRANFFRIDRSPAGDEYSAWLPTMRNPADFHVPAAFGTLRFA